MSDEPRKKEPPSEGVAVGDSFDVVASGYDGDQVDAYVRATNARVAELERELRSVRARIDDRSGKPYARLGARVENLLRLAEDEAADVAARARRQYEQVLAEARKSAAETVRVATSDAKAMRAEADAYREQAQQDLLREREELQRREDALDARIERLRAALDTSGGPLKLT